MTYQTILGIDPGKVNCAYAVIRVKLDPFRYKVMEHGMIQNTLTDMVGHDICKRSEAFKREVRKIVKKHKAGYLIAERYQTRGPKGTNVELVNVMLGLLLSVGVKNVCLITAAQWKNRWNKIHCLNDFYESAGVVVHQIDAANIAFYGASVWFDVPHFQQLANMKLFVKQLKAADIGNNELVRKYHDAKRKSSKIKKPRSRKAATSRRGRAT